MDISQFTTVELKAMIYDGLVQKNAIEQNLRVLEEEINKRQSQPVDSNPVDPES
jgi:hypothetical protein